MPYAVDVVLVIAFAYLLTASLRPPTLPGFLVSLFVLVWTDIVFAAEVLSLGALVGPWAMLAAHAILACLAFLVWRFVGRPSHPGIILPRRTELAASFKSWPDLWALGLSVGLTSVLLAIINILVPPNNMDSMVYHLARVAFWIQHHSLAPWPSPCLPQTAYPLNAEIGSLWSMVFLHRDSLAGFVQWSAALAAMTSIFGMARVFGASRPQAAFASFVYLTLPIVVLQSTTTQNDLTTAAMVAAMAYLLLLGLKTKHEGMLVLSGAAMGLALGMKYTAVMLLPGFLIGLAYVALARSPRPFRRLMVWAGACLGGFVLLGLFNFAQGWIYYRKPLGRAEIVHRELHNIRPWSWTLIRTNAAKDLFDFVDFTGLPRTAAARVEQARNFEGIKVFHSLHIPARDRRLDKKGSPLVFATPVPVPTEAGSFYGPLGFCLFLPLVLYWLVMGVIKKDLRFVPALTFVVFVLVLGGSQAWTPFRGRFYCPVMTLIAPLAAGLLDRGRFHIPIRGFVIVLAITVLAVTVLTDVQKPLVGPHAIWKDTRSERRMKNWPEKFLYRDLAQWIPPKAEVATILTPEDFEYPVFGDRLDRAVYPIFPPPGRIGLGWLKKNPYRYLIVHDTPSCFVEDLPEEEFKVLVRAPFRIIIRKEQTL